MASHSIKGARSLMGPAPSLGTHCRSRHTHQIMQTSSNKPISPHSCPVRGSCSGPYQASQLGSLKKHHSPD